MDIVRQLWKQDLCVYKSIFGRYWGEWTLIRIKMLWSIIKGGLYQRIYNVLFEMRLQLYVKGCIMFCNLNLEVEDLCVYSSIFGGYGGEWTLIRLELLWSIIISGLRQRIYNLKGEYFWLYSSIFDRYGGEWTLIRLKLLWSIIRGGLRQRIYNLKGWIFLIVQ